jgi:hypothetical protein
MKVEGSMDSVAVIELSEDVACRQDERKSLLLADQQPIEIQQEAAEDTTHTWKPKCLTSWEAFRSPNADGKTTGQCTWCSEATTPQR